MQQYFLCRVKIASIYNSFPIVWINHFGAKLMTSSRKLLTVAGNIDFIFQIFSRVKNLKFDAKKHRKNVLGSTLLLLLQSKQSHDQFTLGYNIPLGSINQFCGQLL